MNTPVVRHCITSSSSQAQDFLKDSLLSRKLGHININKPAVTKTTINNLKVASSKPDIANDSKRKMDTCVPSPNLMNTHFAPSPHSLSIYDQERQSIFYGGSKIGNSVDVYGCGAVEESGLLDDNFEDSSFTLTPELLSSMATSSSGSGYTSSNLWDTKVTTEEISSHDQTVETPFIPLGMESDTFISDLLNIDSNDSKFSLPNFDLECMTSNPPSSCHTPVPSSESKSDFLEQSSKDKFSFIPRSKDMVTLSAVSNIGQDFVQKKFTSMKPNFPPRKSEPPVGIVAPVKVPEEKKSFYDHHPIKREVKDLKHSSCAISNTDLTELQPQTVPSFITSPNQKVHTPIKSEPLSPEYNKRKEGMKRSSTEDKWEDVKHFMHDDFINETKSKRRRCDSGSSGVTSEDGEEDDNDYAFHNDDDSDDDLDADLAHMKPGSCESLIGGGKKQKQFFWQYNVQSKGPKGTRLKLAVESSADPHVLNGFEDPVFDEGNTTVAGIRHGGKARKGDGNEVNPNPHKFFKIGHQLLRLNKRINACQLGSDVPLAQRNESRKEKNKLASRACRLKKKAQHEANKIKLHGLEMEHGQINNVLRLLWPKLRERAKRLQNEQHVDQKPNSDDSLTSKLTGYINSNLKSMVAGNTTDYVNNVILTVEKGDLSGGLNIKTRKT